MENGILSVDHPCRVLIVDDDPAELALLEAHLADAGYPILTARNGTDAVTLLANVGASVVITDWVMPGGDGLELCRAIRAQRALRSVYVIMLTIHQTGVEDVVMALDAGADDFVAKPYRPRELLARVRAGERVVRVHRELELRSQETRRYCADLEVANAKLAEANRELNRLATSDELTGLLSRREGIARLTSHWISSERHQTPLACIALDLDRFKSCNDIYGHDVGDTVLKQIGAVLRNTTRRDEHVCRIGGEEFVIICPQATEAMAATGAERVRRAVEAHLIQSGKLTLRTTVSAGVAQRLPEMTCPDDLLKAADGALYAAKDAGRNIVCLASDTRGAGRGAPSTANDAAPDDPAEADVRGARVLVADDCEFTRNLCRRHLERKGYDVVVAVDGEDVLAKVHAGPPDAIVMDAIMPSVDGLECTRRLKHDPITGSIPVIIITARTEGTDITAGIDAGADEYLIKPINPKELALRVRTMVRLRRAVIGDAAARARQGCAFERLRAATATIADADSLDAVVRATLDGALALMKCHAGVTLLREPHGHDLAVHDAVGYPDPAVAVLRVPSGTGVCGLAADRRERVLLDTPAALRAHAHGPDAPLLTAAPAVVVPVTYADRLLLVMALTGREDSRPPDSSELMCLDLLAVLAAPRIARYHVPTSPSCLHI